VHFSLPDPQAGHHRVSLVASLDPAVPAVPGRELELAIDPQRIHFFDPDTGSTL
jgi:hypothetical protein